MPAVSIDGSSAKIPFLQIDAAILVPSAGSWSIELRAPSALQPRRRIVVY
jgi:hypothetical protein